MRTLTKFALAGAAAAAIAGTAYAAGRAFHVLDVALPDGAVAHIQYYGDVAPKVTIARSTGAAMQDLWAPMAFPQIGDLDRAVAEVNRETDAMIRQAQAMAAHPATAAPGLNVASYGNVPARANSVSVVSYSNGGRTCTRTTEVTSQGVGKPPKVTSSISGDCGPAGPSQAEPAGPLTRT